MVLATSGALLGHVPTLVTGPGGLTTIAWPTGASITYRHNTLTMTGPPNVEAGSDPSGAIDTAFQTIGAATGLTFVNGGTSGIQSGGQDGTNLVTFASTAANLALVGGAVAVDVFFFSTPGFQIFESDMVFNPATNFSTLLTANRQDIQSVATHEAGHGVGLDHSPIVGSTMYPATASGASHPRTLSSDDIAGLRSLYAAAPGAPTGSVTGTIQRGAGMPSAGAHVFLQDSITGRAVVGTVSRSTGLFTITGAPPGHYRLVAEPLDGPFVPANLGLSGWGSVTFDTTFRSAVLGGASNPTAVVVKAGTVRNAGTFTVAGPTPTLNLTASFLMSTATGGFSFSNATPAIVTPPYTLFLGIVGAAVNTTADSAFGFDSNFVSITGASTQSGTAGANGYKIFPISVLAAAPPGGYVIRMIHPTTGEVAVAPGLFEVSPIMTPLPYTAPYGPDCPGPGGSVTLAATSPPALGNFGFALVLSNMISAETAIFLISALTDSFPLLGCTVSIEYASLIFPFPGFLIPASGTTATLPLPIPAFPPLAGFEIYVQAGAINPGPSTLRTSRALAIHFQ
jgi:hypothetical protein